MPSLNTRLEVAKSVGLPLIELEKHIDAALVTHARVQVAAIEGHRKARLPLSAGHDAIEKLAAAAEKLIAARKSVHDAHLALRVIQDAMGLGVIAYGDHGDTPREFTELMDSSRPALAIASAA